MNFFIQLALVASQTLYSQAVCSSQESCLHAETSDGEDTSFLQIDMTRSSAHGAHLVSSKRKAQWPSLANHSAVKVPILEAESIPPSLGFSLICPALVLLLYFTWAESRPQPSQTPWLDAQEAAANKSPKLLDGASFVELFYMKAVNEDRDSLALRVWGATKGIECSMTYEQLSKAIQSGHESLIAAKVASGDRVAFYCKGTLDFWVALLSAQSIGATPVLLNWRQSKENLQIMMDDTGVTCVVVGALDELRAEFFNVMPPNVKTVVLLDGKDPQGLSCDVSRFSWHTEGALTKRNLQRDGKGSPRNARKAEALIFFTSGSTNAPKPVLHTYETLMWAAENYVWPERATATLSFLPNFHVIMTLQNFLFPLSRGICASVHAEDATESISANMLLKAADDLQPTIIETVPFIMEEWSAMKVQELKPLQKCTLVQSGGAPLSTTVAARLIEASVPVRQIYGQTEAAGVQLVTIPGATADEMNVFTPPWKVSKVHLEGEAGVTLDDGEGEEGELVIQGIRSSSPGNLANKGVLIPASSKMKPGVGHKTGDVFRWTTTANGRKGLVHCMRTDDVILLNTGEMFNPVPMEKTISEFANGLDGIRNSQIVVLGKNRASPILVVELPVNSKIKPKDALEQLRPAIEEANSREVEYARIKPYYELILVPGESSVSLPKTAKGNFIRPKSEKVLKEMMDDVEQSAKQAQQAELLVKAKAAGYDNVDEFLAKAGSAEKAAMGVDSLGVAMKTDENTQKINVICDNLKAITMSSVLITHFYKTARAPKMSSFMTSLLVASAEVGTVDGAFNQDNALGNFQPAMWVFFLAFGTVDGVQDAPLRQVAFFSSRTLSAVLVISLYKLMYSVMLALNLASYMIDGHPEVAPADIWFLFLVIYYRAIVRVMQLCRFPVWLQVFVVTALPARYFIWNNCDIFSVDIYFWPVNLMLDFTSGLVPNFLFEVEKTPIGATWRGGSDECLSVGLGWCEAAWTPSITIWGSMFDFYGLAHVLAYYYGEGFTLWMMKRAKNIVKRAQQRHGSRGEKTQRWLVVVTGTMAVLGINMLLINPIMPTSTYPQWTRTSVMWMIACVVTFLKVMIAVALPFHCERMGGSTLGIYVLHRIFAFLMFNWAIDVSDFLYGALGNNALTGTLQFVLLVGWTYVLSYTLGPAMQTACIKPVTKLRALLGDT